MSTSLRLRKASVLLGGILLGLLLVGVAAWIYFRAARDDALRDAVGQQFNIPTDAFELEEISPGGPIRVAVRDVALIESTGDTILTAPLVRFLVQPLPTASQAPILVSEVEIRDPILRLVQQPDGEWNIMQALRVTAAGQEVQSPAVEEGGRPLLLRDVRIVDGRALIATPWEPPADTATIRLAARDEDVRLVRMRGETYQIRTLRDLDARLPRVRVGGGDGWRVEIGDLSTTLENPDIRVTQLRGTIEEVREDVIRFAIETLRTENSVVRGDGIIRLAEDQSRYDLELRAEPIAFADLRWLVPALPAEGEARLSLEMETQDDGRVALTVQDAVVTTLDSRVTGGFTVLAGGEAAPVVLDSDLVLDPLDLRVLEVFGLQDELPYAGEIRGRISTTEPAAPGDAILQVDLTASVVPRDVPGVEPSLISVQGPVAIGGTDAPVRFEGVSVQLRPLHLAALRPLLPEQQERLAGVVRGGVTLQGTPRDVRMEGGELIIDVGTPIPTRLAGITGRVSLDPALRYELRTVAEPLALATLTELFPALPFRSALLAGPVEIAGTADSLRFGADLRGDAGGIDASGVVAFGDPLRFDVSGELEAFRTAALIDRDVPVDGPLTGTFAARGTSEDFGFDVDLAQQAGRFTLGGRVRRPDDVFQVAIGGEVIDFRVGTLLGRPGLFAAPVSGAIRVDGGGRQPYRFDVDLRTAQGAAEPAVLDLEGWLVPGDVPAYALSGVIAGLNLRMLPGGDALPPTSLAATVELEGGGTSLETLAGQLSLTATSSSVAGIPLEAALARVEVQNGVLQIDTLLVALAGNRWAASGAWGLTRPAPQPLRYTLNAPNLAALTPILVAVRGEQPRLRGSLFADGSLAGTPDDPVINTVVRGRDLRYDEWRVGSVTVNVDGSRVAGVWTGEAALAADNAVVAGGESFQTIRVETIARPETVSFGVLARRDEQADLAVSGVVERELRGVDLESFALRLGGSTWQLASPARLRWGGIDGVAVDSLVLRRTGAAEGFIEVDGRLPPTGNAELEIRAAGINLSDIRRVLPTVPEIEGILALSAIIEGPVASPELAIQTRIDNLRYRGGAADTIVMTAQYAEGRMETEAVVWVDQALAATARANIPMLLSLEDLTPNVELRDDAPMDASLVADSVPLALLVAAAPQLSNGEGFVSGQIDVSGTPEDPALSGWAVITGGALSIDTLGVRYRQINGRLALENDLIRIDSLTARSGGTALVSGTIQVDDPSQPRLYLTATLNEFRAISRPQVATVAASGQVVLSGRMPTPVVTGRLALNNGTISVPGIGEETPFEIADIEVGGIGADTVSAAVADPGFIGNLRIDGLEVAIGEGVWVESTNDARVQIGGELVVYRAGEDLRVYGDLLAERGTYTLRVGPITREFDVVSGQVRFFGTPDLNPSLDIVAAHRVRRAGGTSGSVLNVLVEITGTLQSPRIQLTSDTRPPLPESELLSYLIFGRPSSEIGGAANRLAQDLLVQELAGGLVLSPLENLLLGVGFFDYVRIRGRSPELGGGVGSFVGSTLGSTSIEAGKELVTNVFLTIECAVAGIFGEQSSLGCGTSLEWQIDDQWSATAAYEPLRRDRLLQRILGEALSYQFSTQLRRRWEYGRPRDPEPRTPTPPEQRLPGEEAEPPPSSRPPPPPPQKEEAPQ
jgi:hypothetical protein